MPKLLLLVSCEDVSFMPGRVRIDWEGDLAGLQTEIANKCHIDEGSFVVEYPDADFDEYVDLDEETYEHLQTKMKLKIRQKKQPRRRDFDGGQKKG